MDGSSNSSSEAALDAAMAAVSDGDRGSFSFVYAALWPRCRSFARRLLDGDAALGDDAAQEALVKLFAQAPRYDRTRSVTAWALTLTMFEVRTLRRRAQRRREAPCADDDDGASSGAPSPEDAAVQRGLVTAALDAVDGLGPADRAAIARALGLDDVDGAAPAVERKRRQRAFERLRGAWRALHG